MRPWNSRNKVLGLGASALLALGLSACGGSSTTASGTNSAPIFHITSKQIQEELNGRIPKSAKSELNNAGPLTRGQAVPGYPQGTPPSPASIFHFTSQEIATLKSHHYTVGIVMHTMEGAWSTEQVAGIRDTLAKFGIKVVGITDANFNPSTQVNNLETMIARHPNVIFSIPVDPVLEASAYKQVTAHGIKLVFMDNVPPGMTPGKDYVDVVAANDGGNARFAADQLITLAGTRGPIALETLATTFWSVNVRYQDAQAVVDKHSHLKAYTETFTNDTRQVYNETTSLLTAHPDIKGIWLAWDVPAENAIPAEKQLGQHVVITTNDLGPVSAVDVANGSISAIGAQRPYQQGVAEANSAAYALLGKKVPPFVEVPTLPVTKLDLIPAYRIVMHTNSVPKDVINTLKAGAAQ